jgi:hypothetical protein
MHDAAEDVVVFAYRIDSDVIRAGCGGLAAAQLQVLKAGGETIKIVCIMISDLARRARKG